MKMWLLVAIGGALGALSRYWLGKWVNRWWQRDLPLGTLVINLSGSFALGLVLGYKNYLPLTVVLAFGTGFLGSFTTYSTLNYEFISLLKQGKYSIAFSYIFLSFSFGLICGFAGLYLAMNL